MCIGFIMIELFDLLCKCCKFGIYIPMYLPQAVSHQPSIGAQSDLFWHTGAALEIQLEPAEATCSLVELPSLLLTRCRDRCTGARPDLS